MWCAMLWCGVVWCGVVWFGVLCCSMVWCGVLWIAMLCYAVVWCGVLCYTVVYCKFSSFIASTFFPYLFYIFQLLLNLSSISTFNLNLHHRS